MFALPTLAVLVLHATPTQVGALFALETLPFPVLGLFVGVLADRISRRRIMIVADIVRFVALGTIPIAAALHVIGMPQLYAVALVSGCASAFFGISYQAYLPAVVATEKLSDANRKLEFSNSGSSMAGSALGGALVQWIGAPLAIAFDAVSYLVSVASLSFIRAAEPPHQGPRLTTQQMAKELAEGIGVVFTSPNLRWILGATATSNLGGSIIGAVFFIYAYRFLHLQPGPLGLVDGLANLGFVGALLSGRVRTRLGFRTTLMVALTLAGVAMGSILIASLTLPYVVLFMTTAVIAISTPIYNVNQISYRQALVDISLQGRLNATMRTFVWGTLPIGSMIGGYLGSTIGVRETILVGGIIATLATAWLIPLRERSGSELVGGALAR